MNGFRFRLASCTVLVACSASPHRAAGTSEAPDAFRSGPSCFLGASDPTLRPEDGWNQAGDAAMAKATEAALGSRVRSAKEVAATKDRTTTFGVALHETAGNLWGVAEVGWWRDREGRGPQGNCRGEPCSKPETTWAVACVVGREAEARDLLPAAFAGPVPDWVGRPGAVAGGTCALGLSGPTLRLPEAERNAAADARRRLAGVLCSVVDHVAVDVRPGGVWTFPGRRPTAEATAAAEGASVSVRVWSDREGRGPLFLKGVTYAQACLDHVRPGCDRSRDSHSP